MFDVVGIGLNAVDYLVGVPRFPVPGEKLRMSSFARRAEARLQPPSVALSRWGFRCKYVGNVGDDEARAAFLLLISREGVDLAHVRTVPGASSQFAVILRGEGTGERTILWDRDPKIRVSPEDLRWTTSASAGPPSRRPRTSPRRFSRRGPPGPLASRSFSMRKGAGGDGGTSVPVRSHRGRGTLPGAAPPGTSAEDGAREILRRYAPRTSTVTLGPAGRSDATHGKRSSRLPSASRRWTPRAPGTFSTPVSCTPFSGAALPGDPRLRQYRGRLSCRGMGAVRDPDARGDPGGRHIDKESILLINAFFKQLYA